MTDNVTSRRWSTYRLSICLAWNFLRQPEGSHDSFTLETSHASIRVHASEWI